MSVSGTLGGTSAAGSLGGLKLRQIGTT